MVEFSQEWIQVALPAVEWVGGKRLAEVVVQPSLAFRRVWLSIERTPEPGAGQWWRFEGRILFALRGVNVLIVPVSFLSANAALGPTPVGEIYLSRTPVSEDEATPDSMTITHHWQGQNPIKRTVAPAYFRIEADRICLVADRYTESAAGFGGAALCVESSDQSFR